MLTLTKERGENSVMKKQKEAEGLVRSRGRPPSPPGVSRKHRVVTFLNDADYQQLILTSAKRGETLSLTAYKALKRGLLVDDFGSL